MRYTGFHAGTVEVITARSGGHCEILATGCTFAATEVHHRRPRGMGGTRRPETSSAANALHACRSCHMRCESFRTWARDNGFVVAQHLNPCDVPVWWRCNTDGYGKRLVLLDDAGGKTPVHTEGTATA